MAIGVVIAMKEELLPIINSKRILAKPKGIVGKRQIFTSQYNTGKNKDTLVFMEAGIGRSNAARATASLIDIGCRAILNVGTCGCTFKEPVTVFGHTFEPKPGEVWIPNKILNADFDLSVFTGKKDFDPAHIYRGLNDKPQDQEVRLLTVDHFSTTSLADYPYLVDMEAYEILNICDAMGCPCRFLKIISDTASEESDKTFDANLPSAMDRSVGRILTDLDWFIDFLHGEPKPETVKKSDE